jgi:hypothetical protein
MTSAVDVSHGPLLRPIELTQDETERLLAVFVQGKTEVAEEDCLTLVRWATEQRLGAALVEWMIQGDIKPVVIGQAVLVEAIDR